MNRILLDSHIFLWAISDSPNLNKAAKRLIETTPQVYVSALSFFELKSKQAKGKLKLPANLIELTDQQEFIILDLAPKQLGTFRIFHASNSDPVDNALLAIAETQRFNFLSADRKIINLMSSYSWIIDGK